MKEATMKVSVVSATYNRGALLDRALATYARQTFPSDQWEYVLVDDCSEDETAAVAARWQAAGLPLVYLHADRDLGLPKVPGQWRDGCKLRNAGSVHAAGLVLVMTHPEILVPPDAVQRMYETLVAHPLAWATAIPYWLPPLADAAWPHEWADDLRRLHEVPGFYDPSWPAPILGGAIDYRNQNQERRSDWESEVWWGMMMARWRWLGGFREFAQWGSVDMDFVARRRVSSTPTVRVTSPQSPAPSGTLMVYHQYHESKRDMDLAMAGVQGTDYSSVDRMRVQGGLFAIYRSGPRERSLRPGLEDILADHRVRYEFAARYATGKTVLDIPCGTGYGAVALAREASAYVGIDRDTESVVWGRDHYSTPKTEWLARTVPPFGIQTGFVDLLVSFEGIEHIADQPGFVAEMARVLKPGGTFILSTPQKGATPGTAWDRYMLTREALATLFAGPEWRRLDWFHQAGYGGPFPVEPGLDSAHPIMILGGTRV
jgi:2-polyprenyl-3-methyl-5-hydroxy-6-metoxy-1,4-benzoquinol methylase